MYEKIMELCTRQSITIKELERRLGFGNGTIGRWKQSSPTVGNLQKVANYFGVNILFFLEDIQALPVEEFKGHIASELCSVDDSGEYIGQVTLEDCARAAHPAAAPAETATRKNFPEEYEVEDGKQFKGQVKLEDLAADPEEPAEEPTYCRDEYCSDSSLDDYMNQESADGFDDLCYEQFEEPA